MRPVTRPLPVIPAAAVGCRRPAGDTAATASFYPMNKTCVWKPVAVAIVGVWAAAGPARAQGTLPLASSDGRRQLTAVAARAPVTIDGALDDQVWVGATPATGFVQAEPHEGQPATESTEIRVAFDGEAIYFGIYCRDADPKAIIVNDIRKDFTPDDQDSVAIILDTFADRRNGFVFYTNSRGAKADSQVANEGREVNPSWDAVWIVKARTVEDGWTAEVRIPFKTLRFERGSDRIWGVNFARRIRRKNELDYWSPVPRAYSIYRLSDAGTLVGLPDVSQGLNLRVKPYVLGGSTRGLGQPAYDAEGKVGLDVKYGLTPALTLDATVNPDFAQAEADEQQVNLTQFSLFYPEKREFFLENSGIFYFGDIPRNTRNVSKYRAPEEELLLFFSRRIGLDAAGVPIPIRAGGRVTGAAGLFGIGALTIQTAQQGSAPGANYTVLRARRNLLANSDVGAILLSRQAAGTSTDYNRVAGVDANFRFLDSLTINSFLARSFTPGESAGQWTGKGAIGWEDNFLHTQYSLLSIGERFRDDVGFVRRTDIRKHFVDFGIRPRPEWLRRAGFREWHPHLRLNRFTNQNGVKVTRDDHFGSAVYFERGGFTEYAYQIREEQIFVPFRIRADVTIPAGDYEWDEHVFVLETDHSRAVSGSARVTAGGFWSGTQRTTNLSLLLRPSYRFQLDVGLQRSDISLEIPEASFVTNLVSARCGYSFSTRMFLDALLQYNTDVRQFSANVRFNLIHRPLSDLFVVYNEQRWTDLEQPAGRSLVVKYTHMLSF